MTTSLEHLIPEILDRVDQRGDDWRRKASLIALVAARTWDANLAVRIGLAELVQWHDGNFGAARWDAELLRQLEERHRVLESFGPHRRPRFWRLRGDRPVDLLEWRKVPWTVPRRVLIAQLNVVWKAGTVGRWTVSAAQTAWAVAVEPPREPSAEELSRALTPSEPPTVPRQPPTLPHFAGEIPPPTAYRPTPETAPGAPPTSSSRSLKPSFLKVPNDEGRKEGGSAQNPEGLALVHALEEATALTIFGDPARRLLELVEAEPDAGPALRAWIAGRSMRHYRVPGAVVRVVLEHWERIGRSSAAQARARREAIEAALAGAVEPEPDEPPADHQAQAAAVRAAKQALRPQIPSSEV